MSKILILTLLCILFVSGCRGPMNDGLYVFTYSNDGGSELVLQKKIISVKEILSAEPRKGNAQDETMIYLDIRHGEFGERLTDFVSSVEDDSDLYVGLFIKGDLLGKNRIRKGGHYHALTAIRLHVVEDSEALPKFKEWVSGNFPKDVPTGYDQCLEDEKVRGLLGKYMDAIESGRYDMFFDLIYSENQTVKDVFSLERTIYRIRLLLVNELGPEVLEDIRSKVVLPEIFIPKDSQLEIELKYSEGMEAYFIELEGRLLFILCEDDEPRVLSIYHYSFPEFGENFQKIERKYYEALQKLESLEELDNEDAIEILWKLPSRE